MIKLVNKKKHNIYGDANMIGKFIYLKRSKNDTDIFYIFKIKEIIHNEYPVEYILDQKYYFTIPHNKSCKCYCYDSTKYSNESFEINFDDELYELTYEEYLNTFRAFIDNDGKYPNEIPSKIIQDI